MENSVGTPERRETAGAMYCKQCGGDVFSVTNLEDQTPITCDQCGNIVGRWADVRALTRIPEKDMLRRSGADIFGLAYRGVAELSLVSVD